MRILTGCPDENEIVCLSLDALGSLLLAQDTSEGTWSSVHALQAINAMLTYIDCDSVMIRRMSTTKLLALLTKHREEGCKAVRTYICDFCLEVLRNTSRADHKRALFVVFFLENILPVMVEGSITKLSSQVLRIPPIEIPQLTAAGISTPSYLKCICFHLPSPLSLLPQSYPTLFA